MKNVKVADLSDAIALAATAFKGKFDRGGNPYILHCLQVMQWVDQDDTELMQIAVLHDVIEDTDYTLDDLINMGYSHRVVKALSFLTHRCDLSYDDYISNMVYNIDAVQVKMADLRHNSDITRMKGLREKDLERVAKYHRSYMFLKGIVNNV